MRHPHELEPERPDLERRLPGLDLGELRRGAEPVLVELRLDECERQPRGHHAADLDLAEHVRQPADVVLVPVREHDRVDGLVDEVAEVRKDEIDAEVLVARERETGVDHDPVVAELEHGHVLPDLAEPAERDDPECLHERSLVLSREARIPQEAESRR